MKELTPIVYLCFDHRDNGENWDTYKHESWIIPRVGDEVWCSRTRDYRRVESVDLMLPNDGAKEPRTIANVHLANPSE